MNSLLKNLESLIVSHVEKHYLPMRDFKRLSLGAARLSEAFTQGRSELPKNYFNLKEARSGYLLYFLLPNVAKVWHCLKQAEDWMPKRQPLKILDVGCGPATAALACSSFFKTTPLEITGLEQNPGILEDAKKLFDSWKQPHHVFRAKLGDARSVPSEKFDLIWLVNTLNEWKSIGEQRRITENLLGHLNPDGLLFIIDPALQKTTRQLMALRDQLLSGGACRVLAPCLHQSNCPMLAANARDWCHFYLDWDCPKIIRAIDKVTGNKHDYLKMAYLVIARGARSLTPFGTGSAISRRHGIASLPLAMTPWRVVSSPLITKGKCELILCGEPGILKKIRRLDKDAGKIQDDFYQAVRGDVIQGAEKETVHLIKKFSPTP